MNGWNMLIKNGNKFYSRDKKYLTVIKTDIE